MTLLVLQAGAVLVRARAGPAPRSSTPRPGPWRRSSSPPHFLYVFEATSILILAALVGAVALARKEL